MIHWTQVVFWIAVIMTIYFFVKVIRNKDVIGGIVDFISFLLMLVFVGMWANLVVW
jgi:NADH:ubiquinone oxidoreductase subunit 6 (subunit J)